MIRHLFLFPAFSTFVQKEGLSKFNRIVELIYTSKLIIQKIRRNHFKPAPQYELIYLYLRFVKILLIMIRPYLK